MPPFGLATRDVYARFDEMGLGDDDAAGRGARAGLARVGATRRAFIGAVGNDLGASGVPPSVRRWRHCGGGWSGGWAGRSG